MCDGMLWYVILQETSVVPSVSLGMVSKLELVIKPAYTLAWEGYVALLVSIVETCYGDMLSQNIAKNMVFC